MTAVTRHYDRLSRKIAIVTGAAGGIGRAIAVKFAQEGAKVVATTRKNLSGLDETVRMAPQGSVVARQVDSSCAAQVRDLVAFTVRELGKLDIICNNAGIITDATLAETTEEEWDQTLDINLKGVFLGCKYAIPEMMSVGGGSIINIGSVNSFVGEPLHSAYCASKGGILMLTKCAAIEYAKYKIRANCICPGWVDTPMNAKYIQDMGGYEKLEKLLEGVQPLGNVQPEDVAATATFLASDESSLITGSAIMVDGGLTAQ
jgi:NAD(P)-dependent dehydrogenase (short-subunit alcohol dehydrogenase family)